LEIEDIETKKKCVERILRFAQLIVMLERGGWNFKAWGWNTAGTREVNTYVSLRLGNCDRTDWFIAEN